MSARNLEMMSLNDIASADKNPKRHAHEDISKSISRFGYIEPVVLDERTGRLVAGHGRVEAIRAAQKKGEAPPQGIEERDGSWFVPVLRGWSSRSDAEAQAYLLASNRLTEVGGWDAGELTDLLKELDASNALDGVGYSEDDLRKLIGDASLLEVNESGEPDANGSMGASVAFGVWRLPVTEEVAKKLEARIKAWVEASGTTHGFIADLLAR